MNAIAGSLPELVGGSADLDPSTKTYLKGFGDFEPESYAGRNIHFGVREHAMAAATNGIAAHGGLLPFARPSSTSSTTSSPHCAWRRSTRSARSTSSPTTRCSWAKTARRISRSSSSRCCARRRIANRSPGGRARDARSLEVRGPTGHRPVGAHPLAPETAVSGRPERGGRQGRLHPRRSAPERPT